MSIIRTRGLSKTYKGGTQALVGLDLEVEAAEVFGFIGPNGAGKSTTIELLLNFIRPDAGTASLFGQPVETSGHRKRLGYLPESVNLHTYYTGRRLLEFYAGLSGIPSAVRAQRAEEMLALVSLEEVADRKVSKYSKGMVQRLGLAQALMNDPELLILDGSGGKAGLPRHRPQAEGAGQDGVYFLAHPFRGGLGLRSGGHPASRRIETA